MFKPIKRDSRNPVEGYEFDMPQPFDRGEPVGVFGYVEFDDPAKNNWSDRANIVMLFKAGITYRRSTWLTLYNRLGTESSLIFATETWTPAVDTPCTLICFVANSGQTYNLTLYPQIELGPTATPYEPHKGGTHTKEFEEPLHGLPGAEDEYRSDGRIVRRTAPATITSTTSMGADLGDVMRFSANITPSAASSSRLAKSSHFTMLEDYTSNTEHFYVQNNQVFFFVSKSRLASNDNVGINAWLSGEVAAGTPVQILYELATPIIEYTPPLPIPAHRGVNTVYTNAGGETTVTGRLSPRGMVEELEAKVEAQGERISTLEELVVDILTKLPI